MADNASVLSRNPAAMTQFDKMAFSVSGTYIKPDVDVNGDIYAGSAKMAGASESGIAPSAFVPATYFIQPLNDQWAWGIGLFSNYGLSTEYTGELQRWLHCRQHRTAHLQHQPEHRLPRQPALQRRRRSEPGLCQG